MIAASVRRRRRPPRAPLVRVGTQFLDLPQPLALDCGRELHPIRIAYETTELCRPHRQRHPRLPRAERRCPRGRVHGDAGRRVHGTGSAPTSARRPRPRPRLVGRHDWPWQGVRHGPLLRRQLESSWRVPGDNRPFVDEPGNRPAVGSDFPVITVSDMVRAERAFLNLLGIKRLARWPAAPWRDAGTRMGHPVRP